MYEDAPQELVHDLIADAVFADHPLGRPVIGTADVISSIPRDAIARYHDDDVRARRTSSSLPRGTSSTSEVVELVERALAATGRAVVAPVRTSGRRSCRRRRRACASSGRTPSSTTSASAAPGISRSDRRRFAASLLDAILGGSASSRLFQEIREKRGMAYAVYSFVSQYTDTGQIGIYLGTREENLGEALAIAAEQIADVAAGNVPERRARAREGEPEGTDPALDGVDVDADEPARQVADHRLGAAVARPHRRGDRRRRGGLRRRARGDVPRPREAVGRLHRPERGPVSWRRSTRSRRRSARPREARPERAAAARSARCSHRRSRQQATSSSGSLAGADAMVDFTTPAAVLANIEAAVAGRRAVRRRNERLGYRDGARRDGGRLLRAELRARRRADDALRRAGGAVLPASRDRRAAPRDEGRRAVGHGDARRRSGSAERCRSTRFGCRGSSRTRRCCSAARARC